MARSSGATDGYSFEHGEAAVRVARSVVEAAVRGGRYQRPAMDGVFERNAGVFTTLNLYPSGTLRGCIGFAEPLMALGAALVQVSRAAALEDTRFSPVVSEELGGLLVEVSLLTPPQEIRVSTPDEIPAAVEVGRHGLIVRQGRARGLLLPQVASEWRWGAQEFLEHTCRKAGLDPDGWRDDGTRVLVFGADVFGESTPSGEVVRHGPSWAR